MLDHAETFITYQRDLGLICYLIIRHTWPDTAHIFESDGWRGLEWLDDSRVW